MRCAGCQLKIRPADAKMSFQKNAAAPIQNFHSCCYQEILLCEVWGALTIGIKYESQCLHTDKTSQFNPITLTKDEIRQTIEKAMARHLEPKPGDMIADRYRIIDKLSKDKNKKDN